MTEVAFHFNAPDKLGYVCRFVRKALRHGAQVTVTAPPGVLAHLSARLWKSAPSDFLAHAAPGADAQVLAAAGQAALSPRPRHGGAAGRPGSGLFFPQASPWRTPAQAGARQGVVLQGELCDSLWSSNTGVDACMMRPS